MPDYRLATKRAAQKIGVDPGILLRLVNQESHFDPSAHSSAGAQGIAQFMPGTAKAYGVNLNDNRVTDDLEGAARYLRANLDKYGSYARALSVYNSGKPDAYKNPNFAGGQTYNYVRDILHGQTPSVSTGAGSSGSGGGRVGSGPQSVTVTPGSAQNGFDPGPQTAPGLAGLLSQPQAPPVAIPIAPTPAIQSPVIQPPPVQGGLADALAAIQTGPQQLPESQTSSPSVKVTGGGGPIASAASASPSGGRTVKFDGKPVVAWMVPALQYARAHGWKGQVISGVRSHDLQSQLYADYKAGRRAGPVAVPGHSNHEIQNGGAVDVSDPYTLARIMAGYKGRKLRQGTAIGDPPHFSATGR